MDEHHSRRCSQDPRSSSITPIGPLSPGPLSPTSPTIPQHFFSREESREIPETPGFKLLKDLSEHIEKRTGTGLLTSKSFWVSSAKTKSIPVALSAITSV